MMKMFRHWLHWLALDIVLVFVVFMALAAAKNIIDGQYGGAFVNALFGWIGYRTLKGLYTDLAVEYPNEAAWPDYYVDPKVVEFIDGAAGIIRNQQLDQE